MTKKTTKKTTKKVTKKKVAKKTATKKKTAKKSLAKKGAKKTKASIPQTIKIEVQEIIDKYNQRSNDVTYVARFRGRFLYLDRDRGFTQDPIFRLTYQGDMTSWEAAIYKWSTERYDANDSFFPGSSRLNGTILGALEAGIRAYP